MVLLVNSLAIDDVSPLARLLTAEFGAWLNDTGASAGNNRWLALGVNNGAACIKAVAFSILLR